MRMVCEEAVRTADPDLVMHLAAESHVDRSISGPGVFIESNVTGTYNLLQAVREHYEGLSGDRRDAFQMHHISTDEVFGSLDAEGRFSETTPYDPRSPYSSSKAASDHLVQAWHHTYQLPVVLTNCSNNYGPWQFPEKLIPVVILKASAGMTSRSTAMVSTCGTGCMSKIMSMLCCWRHAAATTDAATALVGTGKPPIVMWWKPSAVNSINARHAQAHTLS